VSTTTDPALRLAVAERDGWRCRFCGRTNVGIEAHHIVYRSHGGPDTLDNLICLDRDCHGTVHGLGRLRLPKADYADILTELVASPGLTGLALLRQRKAA
jgi:5-methylcytosine-specific restriction endonuclease McrA